MCPRETKAYEWTLLLAEVDQLVGNFVFGEVMLGRHNVLEQSLFDRTPAQLI